LIEEELQNNEQVIVDKVSRREEKELDPSPNLRLLNSSIRRVRQKKVATVIVLEEENNSTHRDSGRQSIGEF